MVLTFLGTRGSVPFWPEASLSPALWNGPLSLATTCVKIQAQDFPLWIDLGTGVLNEFIPARKRWPYSEIHVLMTHFHLDHILGLPFFEPLWKGDLKRIHIYHPSKAAQALAALFRAPLFPVRWDYLQNRFEFHKISWRRTFRVGPFQVTAFPLDHPDVCAGYRVEHEGFVYVHASDTNGVRVTRADLGRDAVYFEKAQVIYFDAAFTQAHWKKHQDWGHGCPERAWLLAQEFHIPWVVLGHLDFKTPLKDMQNYVERLKKRRGLGKIKFFEYAHDGLRLSWDYQKSLLKKAA